MWKRCVCSRMSVNLTIWKMCDEENNLKFMCVMKPGLTLLDDSKDGRL